MRVLAVDTSCMMGSVALLDDDSVVAEQMLNIKITHSERLIPSIKMILDTAGLSLAEVDVFAVAIGPGSFTGLRIGLAAIKGMAFIEKKPVVGVSSLLALAYNLFGTERHIVSVLDARRGEFYVSVNRFKGDKLDNILEDTVMPPDQLIQYVSSLGKDVIFVGDGVYSLKDIIRKQLGKKAMIPPPGMIHPRASNIAWIARLRVEKGEVDDLAALVPNYIRKSDAEKNA